jgi:glucose-1-phosphate adenylyltransferase
MDYREMIKFHLDKHADVTVAAVEMDKKLSPEFGVIEIDSESSIVGFQEKPTEPKTLVRSPDKILASMGIYIFNTEIVVRKLIEDAKRDTAHDFGKNIVPEMVGKHQVYAYLFKNERGEPHYWRDVGTIEAYFESNIDLVSESPLLDLYDPEWPIHTYHPPLPPAKTISDGRGVHNSGAVMEAILSGGCVISGGEVKRSLLSPNVRIEKSAVVEDSIVLEGARVKENAHIKRTIIDKESEVPAGMYIGYDHRADAKNFTVTESGIVVISKGFRAR